MIPWVVAAGSVVMALLVVQQRSRGTGSAGGSVTRLDLDLPAGVELVTVYPPGVVLSPDGTWIAEEGVVGGRSISATGRCPVQCALLTGARSVQFVNVIGVSGPPHRQRFH
jgi:hypothetical protein